MISHAMKTFQNRERSGVLNTTTMTLHKQETGMSNFQTPCGHLSHVAQEGLQIVDIKRVENEYNMSRCGQCFEDSGGY